MGFQDNLPQHDTELDKGVGNLFFLRDRAVDKSLYFPNIDPCGISSNRGEVCIVILFHKIFHRTHLPDDKEYFSVFLYRMSKVSPSRRHMVDIFLHCGKHVEVHVCKDEV